MEILSKAALLFGLNFLDAVLTLFWVKNKFAEEGNVLMAHLLHLGDAPFLIVKTLMGALALLVFYRYADLRISQIGVTLALAIYIGLMFVHAATGISAIN